MKVKFSKPNINAKDIKMLLIYFKADKTHGKYTQLFEKSFAALQEQNIARVSSYCWTSFVMYSPGFKKGDEVIVPAMTHTAAAHAVEFTGASNFFRCRKSNWKFKFENYI